MLSGDSEIRWNGIDGPLLGEAAGSEISVPVTIPEADPGLYTVIVFERLTSGGIGNKATASFLVTSGDEEPATAGATSGDGERPAVRPAPSSEPSSDGGIGAGVALAGGAGLLALGGVGGGVIARRRTAAHAPGPA